jgi:hypothetical protein
VALALLPALAAGPAQAGGPLLVRGNGLPYAWSTAAPIAYRTDNGPMSATVNEATAQGRVVGMFDVWQAVATSSISYSRAGFISPTGAFTGGDVDTLAEYDAVDADCGNGGQSPVVYDADGSIVSGLGMDVESVIGFASPCSINATQFGSGLVVMNGLFQDGQDTPGNPEIPDVWFNAAIIHEIGHFSGLDHSQINLNCLNGCVGDDLIGLPTMFPFLVTAEQSTLSMDDIAWISRLHPQTTGGTTFAGTHGTISGVVFFSDGQSHAQFVNVIARQLVQGRRNAVSVISGYKFRAIHGNSLTGDPASPFGSVAPGDIGLFEIAVPAGSYTIEFESVDPEFVDGSSIGAYQIPMPGTAPVPIGPIVVSPNAVSSGNDVTLIGTPPRFDQFEGQ